MKYIALWLLGSFCTWAATPPGVVIHSAKDLNALTQKLAAQKGGFASKSFEKYKNHYTMLAVRTANGSAELHEHEADILFVVSGQGTLVSGGKIVNPKTQKEGEIRGTSISGGERQPVETGDVIHVDAGVPHQLLIPNGTTFSYFVVKVTGQ